MYALCNTYMWMSMLPENSGKRGDNANKNLRSAPNPPLPLVPPLWMFESRIYAALPSFHKLNSDPGFSYHTIHMKNIHLYLHLTRHHLGLETCSMPALFHNRHLAAVSCLAGARSVGGENSKLKLRYRTHSSPSLSSPGAADL